MAFVRSRRGYQLIGDTYQISKFLNPILIHQGIPSMETLSSSTSMSFPREPANYDEIAMHETLLFSESLKDLTNLRKQLYSAAEYFELSYTNDDQKQMVVDTLKDYAIKAIVNTVDHLGAASNKVDNIFDDKVEEVSGSELRVSCIEQRVRTCHGYFDHEGVSQQSSLLKIPKYHKRYVLPVGEMIQDGNGTILKHEECTLVEEHEHEHEHDQHEHMNEVVQAIIHEKPGTLVRKEQSPSSSPSPSPSPQASQQPDSFSFEDMVTRKDFVYGESEKRAVSPPRFPLLHTESFSSRSRSNTPNSRSSTPNSTRPTTQTTFPQQWNQEPRKSVSKQRNGDRETWKEGDQIQSKSKRLLKALLSRRKSKKDEMLYTYLDEY
ncbi:unnamed protein product [Lactuca saligna]|uniref:Uncharacterized protein n=1 Tax=Lactuca saligna TaxID=75948 RepID=A0AA36A0D9_LACSI|nr:unnamed protein product [Lactuca saligna]